MKVPGWIVGLVTLIAWFTGTGLALTPDGLALLEFKDSLTTISPLLESWNASDPSPCSWGGINCTDTGEVLNISLYSKVPKLEGHLSASLGKLKSLEWLLLYGNLLSGSIPPEIGNLKPPEGAQTVVSELFGEIPSQLFNCRNLDTIWLNSNNFRGDATTVLEEVSKLPAIKQVGLDDNSFKGTLPPSIGNATSLTFLSVGNSFVRGGQRGGGFGGQIPKELGKLANLSTLLLGDNPFTGGIPPELQNMSSLSVFDVGETNLSGEIPLWLGNVRSLVVLVMTGNNLSGAIPSNLGNLANLSLLDLSFNKLTGTIPSSLGNLVNLIEIWLANNSLTGQIPPSFTSFIHLEYAAFYYNNLSGPLPQDFGRFMPNLTTLYLAYNSINGTLPDGLCEGGKLQWLTTTYNNFEGPIPASLAGCKSLVQPRFTHNQFTSIPAGFGNNTSLYYLDVSFNHLSGPLPRGLGTNSSLAFLHLNDNKLTGDISSLEFSQLRNLTSLNLANNSFTGEIPAAMAVCKLLYLVDLSQNSLTGAVPLDFVNLTSLQELHLQGNNLTEFHPSIYEGFAPVLRILNLADNPWDAPIGDEFGSLRGLQSLNLSFGGRTGPIPPFSLGQLTQLQVLDLSHNNLTGEVPSALGELMTSLISVNISFNNLTGSIPPAWVKLLLADPASFSGNPGLCLQYNTDNKCIHSPSVHGGGKLRFSVKVTVGVVLIALLGVGLALSAFATLCYRRLKFKVVEMPAEYITTRNLTNEPLPLTFEDILSATDNLNDRYMIGKGGYGVVYKVKCPSDTCPYIAAKKIELVDGVPTSFWREVEIVGQARHRNLVRLLGFIKRDKIGLLLYDYISNGDLYSALHNPKAKNEMHLTWKARLGIAQGVAHGLAYLHHDYDTHIVHRDIKSSNVLLDDDLEPYISDFGVAMVLCKQLGSKQFLSSSMNVFGTYGYIAPEVGCGGVVTSKVDVYSYGVLLLELLTGKLPAQDLRYGEALHIVAWVKQKVQFNQVKVNKSILDPLLLDPASPAATNEMLFLQEIALLCTQENPADRPSMREVENLLITLQKTVEVTYEDGV